MTNNCNIACRQVKKTNLSQVEFNISTRPVFGLGGRWAHAKNGAGDGANIHAFNIKPCMFPAKYLDAILPNCLACLQARHQTPRIQNTKIFKILKWQKLHLKMSSGKAYIFPLPGVNLVLIPALLFCIANEQMFVFISLLSWQGICNERQDREC